jgi:hypothetical protein
MRYSSVMRAISFKGFLWVAAVLTVLMQASAIETKSTTRDYQTIVERNPFGLKPPPPPPAAPTNEPPKVEFYLTGITSIGESANRKRAYLMSKDAKAPTYYSLTEGQSKDGLEILQIDAKNKSVKIRNNGIEKLMTFASDRIPEAKVAAPAPGARPGQPGIPPPLPFPNAAAPPGGNPPNGGMNSGMNNNPGPRNIPSRSLRSQPPPTYGGASGVAPIPSPLSSPLPTQAITANGITPQPDMNAEEQIAILRAQAAAANPGFNLPPNGPVPRDQFGNPISPQNPNFPPIPPP